MVSKIPTPFPEEEKPTDEPMKIEGNRARQDKVVAINDNIPPSRVLTGHETIALNPDETDRLIQLSNQLEKSLGTFFKSIHEIDTISAFQKKPTKTQSGLVYPLSIELTVLIKLGWVSKETAQFIKDNAHTDDFRTIADDYANSLYQKMRQNKLIKGKFPDMYDTFAADIQSIPKKTELSGKVKLLTHVLRGENPFVVHTLAELNNMKLVSEHSIPQLRSLGVGVCNLQGLPERLRKYCFDIANALLQPDYMEQIKVLKETFNDDTLAAMRSGKFELPSESHERHTSSEACDPVTVYDIDESGVDLPGFDEVEEPEEPTEPLGIDVSRKPEPVSATQQTATEIITDQTDSTGTDRGTEIISALSSDSVKALITATANGGITLPEGFVSELERTKVTGHATTVLMQLLVHDGMLSADATQLTKTYCGTLEQSTRETQPGTYAMHEQFFQEKLRSLNIDQITQQLHGSLVHSDTKHIVDLLTKSGGEGIATIVQLQATLTMLARSTARTKQGAVSALGTALGRYLQETKTDQPALSTLTSTIARIRSSLEKSLQGLKR